MGTIRKASGCRGRFRFRSRDFGCVLRRPFACDAEAARRSRFAVAQRAVDGRVARFVRDRPVRRVNPLQRECSRRASRQRPRVLVSGARREGRNSVRGLGGERVGGLLPAANQSSFGGTRRRSRSRSPWQTPRTEPAGRPAARRATEPRSHWRGCVTGAEPRGGEPERTSPRERRQPGARVEIDSNGPGIGRAGTRHRRDHEAIADVHDSSVNRIEGRPASLGCSTSAAETLRPGTVLRDERSGRRSQRGGASRITQALLTFRIRFESRIVTNRRLSGCSPEPRPGSCRSPWSHPRRWRPHLPIRI